MPNKDGTGPTGKGPLTGRGFGNCEGAKECSPNKRRNKCLRRGERRGRCSKPE